MFAARYAYRNSLRAASDPVARVASAVAEHDPLSLLADDLTVLSVCGMSPVECRVSLSAAASRSSELTNRWSRLRHSPSVVLGSANKHGMPPRSGNSSPHSRQRCSGSVVSRPLQRGQAKRSARIRAIELCVNRPLTEVMDYPVTTRGYLHSCCSSAFSTIR